MNGVVRFWIETVRPTVLTATNADVMHAAPIGRLLRRRHSRMMEAGTVSASAAAAITPPSPAACSQSKAWRSPPAVA